MKRTNASPAADLAEAHRELLGNLRQLEQAADALPDGDEGELLARLEATRARLDNHFRFEEANGYMQAVLDRAPQLERKVQHLRDEHGELRQSLDALTRRAGGAQVAPQRFREGLKEWVGRLRDHEKRENLLVEDVFNCDVAAED
jgi:hemerythrin-like domain-containing protein